MPDYGLKVYNGSNKLILDSAEALPTFISVASGTLGTVTNNLVDYPGSITIGDLFFVRLPGSGFIAENYYSGSGTRKIYTTYTSSQQWIKLDKTTSNVSSHTSGYGLNVFDATGGATPDASDLLFSTNTTTSVDIAAIGSWSDMEDDNLTEVVYTCPAQWSQTNHYVLLNGTFYTTGSTQNPLGGGDITYTVKMGYEFNYSNNTLTNIKIQGEASGAALDTGGVTNTYMIVRLRS